MSKIEQKEAQEMFIYWKDRCLKEGARVSNDSGSLSHIRVNKNDGGYVLYTELKLSIGMSLAYSSESIHFCNEFEKIHSVIGPSELTLSSSAITHSLSGVEAGYHINNTRLTYEEWEKHPVRMDYLTGIALKEVMGED